MLDQRISLDGAWDFLHVADDRLSGPVEVRSITVPRPWQAEFSELRMRAGIGIYRRTVEIPEAWIRDGTWLRFGAVFHNSKVWINGELVGSNEGGFLPFSFDVTRFLKPGPNEFKVRVDSPTDNPAEFPDSPFAEIPFGKQSWYGPLSGIWQSVYLERRAPDHLTRLRLVPDWKTGRVAAARRDPRPAGRARARGRAGGRARRHRLALRVHGRRSAVLVAGQSGAVPGEADAGARGRAHGRDRGSVRLPPHRDA